MCTPDISHISSNDYNFIYEPAEDTFLLIDAIEKEVNFLQRKSPVISLEIGSGSGICSAFLAKEIGRPIFSLCTDINVKAAEVTHTTGKKNMVQLHAVLTDLVNGLLPRLTGQVDVLLFNPPYVVTPSEEVGSTGIEASWAGGKDGREVIDRVLPLVPQLLAPDGVFYMVVIKENKAGELLIAFV
ncbi:N6MT1-like protein [Mya arenaria]|uniref:N6MT1-like protein n=1 Tax=Mya arenaria TaxID=6604 RepID=A0ABY7EYH5_MYAAR|nr:N6MT1-like protein [Mya arenaria]